MARIRLAFIIGWLVLFLSAQLPLLLIFTAVNFERYTVIFAEILAAIFTAMMTGLMMVKEHYDGR